MKEVKSDPVLDEGRLKEIARLRLSLIHI